MSFSVMSDVPNPIIVDAAGTAGSGYVLKAFLPGGTTSTSIFIDANGSSPQATITANSEGKWEVTGNEILPYIDRVHKWGIFANASDATNNSPFYMGPFDNITPIGAVGVVAVQELTTATMTANTAKTYADGDIVGTAAFSTGNGGGGVYDVVLTSSVTPNTHNIIIGVADNLISFVLRVDEKTTVLSFGVHHTTDTTAAMLAALTYYGANGGTAKVPYPLSGDKYVLDDKLTISPVKSMAIECDEGVLFDMTGSSSEQDGLKLQAPALASATSITNNVLKGERLITSTLASSLTRGDVIKIISTDNFTPEVLENLGSGEFTEVESIDGNDIRLTSGLSDNYTAANTTISILSDVSISISNLRMERSIDNGRCFDVRNSQNVLLENCHAEGSKERGLWIRNCYKVRVIGCSSNAGYTVAVNTNYGLAIDSSDHVLVDGGSYCAGRHGVKTGAVSGEGIGRFIVYKNLDVSNVVKDGPSSSVACFDAHDVCDYITADNCKISNGLLFQAPNITVKNCALTHAGETDAFNSMLYYWPLNTGGVATIEDNILEGLFSNINDFGIRVNIGNSNFDSLTLKKISISGNSVTGVGTPCSVHDWDATNSKIRSLTIVDNDFFEATKQVILIGALANTRTKTIDRLVIDNNLLEGTMKLFHAGVSTIINANTMDGLSTYAASDFDMSGDLILTSNQIADFTDNKGGIDITSVYLDNIVWQGNVVNTPGTMSFPFPRRAIIVGDGPFGIVSADNSAPRGGLWTTFDSIHDNSPTAFRGWVVSTAGYGVQGAWAATTSVIAGRQFTNAGNVYRVTVSGTSGSVAPTFTSGEQADGSSTLEFIATSSAIAVFNTYGVVTP